jgi:erythromycin esterase-like protein
MYFRNRRDAGRLLAQPLAAYANRPDVVVLGYLDKVDPDAAKRARYRSHLGDARAREMSARGELNVGQLMRERYGRESHCIYARPSEQFDAVIHFDHTRAVGHWSERRNWSAPTCR